MKLTHKDKIILIIVLFAVTWFIGVFTFIKPKLAEIKTNKTSYEAKELEKKDIDEKIKQGENLPEQVTKAYEDGVLASKNFFAQKQTFEVDRYVKSILDDDQIKIMGLSISQVSTSNLEYYSIINPTISYPLLIAADLNGKNVLEAPPALLKGEMLANISVSFTYSCSLENLKRFLDNIQTAEQKSLIVNNISISGMAGTEVTGAMAMTIYFMETLDEPVL